MTEQEWLTSTDPRPMLEYLKGPPSFHESDEAWAPSLWVQTHEAKRISDRKARLLGVAFCRLLSDLYDEPHCQRLIDYGLKYSLFESRAFFAPKVPNVDCCLRAIKLAERAADEAIPYMELFAFQEGFTLLCDAGTTCEVSDASEDEHKHLLVATSYAACAIEAASCGAPFQYGISGSSDTLGPVESLEVVVRSTADAAAFRKGLAFEQSVVGGDPDNKAANANLLRDIAGNPFRPVAVDPSWLTSTVLALAGSIYADRAFARLPVLADALQDAGCENADILNHCRGDGPHARGCWVVDLILGKA